MSHQIAQCTILLQCPVSHLKLYLALKRKGNKEGFPEEPRVEGSENVDNTSRIGFHSLGETNVIWTPHVPPAKQGTMEKIRWWVWVLYCNFSPLDYAKRPALWTAVTSGNQCPQSAPFCDKRFSATSPGVPRCSQVCPCPPSTLSHGKWAPPRRSRSRLQERWRSEASCRSSCWRHFLGSICDRRTRPSLLYQGGDQCNGSLTMILTMIMALVWAMMTTVWKMTAPQSLSVSVLHTHTP